MMQGVHVLGSRLIGQKQELNVIADNVANVNTQGFKRLTYGYEEITGRHQGQEVADYVRPIGVIVDHSAGPVETTNNPLDLALEGDAYFAVDVDGQTQYTRNGHFSLSPTGALVNGFGQPVLDSAGTPINIPVDAENISFTPEGSIATENGVVAELGIFNFSADDQKVLNRSGNGGFFAPDTVVAQRANEDVTVLQGRLESSNVQPVEELVKMQELSKAYQQSLKMLKSMEDIEERAIRNLSTQKN